MQGEHVGLRWRPIEAEPALAYLPGIIGIATVWAHRVIAIEILRIDPEVRVLTQLATVAHAAKAAFRGATPCREQPSLRIPGPLGDNVDDTIDRVGPLQRRSWPAYDLNALDIF